MEEEGFHFNPRPCASMEEVRELIAEAVFTDEIDLILVDWDLGQGVYGQDAITAIRETVPYKDVVFYSAHSQVNTLRKLAFDSGIEGVYCASREELVEEVLGVFNSLVKKVLDLDHTRGIVMGATSDIDNMVNECLLAVHGMLDDERRQAMVKEALERIAESIDGQTRRAAELKEATTMDALFKAHRIFTANDRLRILSRYLEAESFKAHAGYRPTLVTYLGKVVPGRNDLGHLVMVPEGKPQAVSNIEGKQISLEETRELRRLILGLRGEFRKLLLALQEHRGNAASTGDADAGGAE
jgi:DNA-binding NarL/FixJ family response regulator